MSSFVLASVATARVWYLQTQDTCTKNLELQPIISAVVTSQIYF